MTEEAAKDLITQVDGWNLITEDGPMKLSRSWKVKSFTKGLELFKLVADVAEAEDHHPDLHLVGWNNVTIEIWTHSVVGCLIMFHKDQVPHYGIAMRTFEVILFEGGLTENDFILAAKINAIDLHHLLRRKVAK
ncbi:hypothetical protein TIFTF001_012558 [Ficus carica]|uniref:4a-hydroxytetrahydrobiopterin dehydratase n=1 Tax=Ficus carica TaxID=3494 RepID=A0AA88A079_FICCA|nr:hypothetical protein TIFTF001_012558 [Ficus carica]